MRYTEVEVGKEYIGAYGRHLLVLEKLGTYEERVSPLFSRTIRQALRVRDRRTGAESVIAARSLNGPWGTTAVQTEIDDERFKRAREQFQDLLAALEPFGVRGRITGTARSGKPGELHLSAAAIDHLHALLVASGGQDEDPLSQALNLDQ